MSTYMGILKKIVVVLVILVVAAIGWYIYSKKTADNGTTFKTATVSRGDVLATISSTGTVEPEEVVDVGAQVAGLITSFGKDKSGKTVDYGSEVGVGTVLALIDDSTYTADVQSATAGLDTAKANVVRAEADIKQLKAKLYQADRDWQRAQKLGISEAMAESTYDSYQSAYETAVANVAIGEAVIEQAKSSVEQAEATLTKAKRNLAFCVITSPVDGVVIDRRVNIGQTVVSSLNAPSLFLIAKDLNRMLLWVPVNEADIGSIHAGQDMTFTVDALPGEKFIGQVRKIRLNASMTQNVVTYVVEVTTDNSSGKLLPYLSASALFEVNHHEGVLTVQNAALRWAPLPSQIAPIAVKSGDKTAGNSGGKRQRRDTASEANKGTLWVIDGKYVKAIPVTTGLTDGVITEVEGKSLEEGLVVVTGEEKKQAADTTQARSPFTPQFRRPGGSGSGGGTGSGAGGPPPRP
jgi:HlyD family secretion protein